jgi:GNAT superfamily N-acetyltransferase
VLFLPSARLVDLTKLQFLKLSSTSKLEGFDCTEADGTDPVGLQEFIQKEALVYQSERIGVTYLILHGKDVVAFITVSMNCLSVNELEEPEKIAKVSSRRYPALLLGRLGVDKRFRDQNVGTYLCLWVIGLARQISQFVGCRYVTLHTLPEKTPFYKREPLNFIESSLERSDNKKLLYRRIVDESVSK